MKTKIILLLVVIALSCAAYIYYQAKQNDATPLVFWQPSNESNLNEIDHSAWQDLLENYIDTENEVGVFLFDYINIEEEESTLLANYINQLASLDPREFRRTEQMAYWINLYNALTVKLIVDNYPLASITTLGETLGAFGPWDDQLITIAGQSLSLNDIEHRILRAFWKDPRIHFAVNCASYGCPDLQDNAFTSENLESLLDKAAESYLSHPRGAYFDGDELVLSSIFDWYAEDFGANQQEVLNTLSQYLPNQFGEKLKSYQGSIRYEYEWGLNDVEAFE